MRADKLVPQLIETNGPDAGRVHELPYGEHLVGRGGDATVQLHDKDVSRRHARLEVGPEGVLVHDLGSKNGVFVQGARVEQPILLKHGQTLSFGDLTLRLAHPASQVSQALAAAGEATMTSTRTTDVEPASAMGLVLPLLGVVVFGGLVAALLLL